jgi:hypothetical protein
MTRTISRRSVLAAAGFSALADQVTSEMLHAQSLPVGAVKDDYKEDFFYRSIHSIDLYRRLARRVLAEAGAGGAHPWQRRIERGMVCVGAAYGPRVSPHPAGLGRTWPFQRFTRLRILARQSREVRHARTNLHRLVRRSAGLIIMTHLHK